MNKIKNFILIPNTSKKIPKENIDSLIDRITQAGGGIYVFGSEFDEYDTNKINPFTSRHFSSPHYHRTISLWD